MMERNEKIGRLALLILGVGAIVALGLGADGTALFLMACIIGFYVISW